MLVRPVMKRLFFPWKPRGKRPAPLARLMIMLKKKYVHAFLRRLLRGSFLALSAPGHAGGPPVHWAQVWVPGGLRGACSGCSKSRNLASNHGVALRGARAEQDIGKLMPATSVKPMGMTLCYITSFSLCKAQQHFNNNRFKLSSVLVYELCVCSVYYVCACVCTGLSMTTLLGCCVLGRRYSTACTASIFIFSVVYS